MRAWPGPGSRRRDPRSGPPRAAAWSAGPLLEVGKGSGPRFLGAETKPGLTTILGSTGTLKAGRWKQTEALPLAIPGSSRTEFSVTGRSGSQGAGVYLFGDVHTEPWCAGADAAYGHALAAPGKRP